jgi:hypothetical protein
MWGKLQLARPGGSPALTCGSPMAMKLSLRCSSTESGMALRATEGDEDATAHRQLFKNGFGVDSMDSVAWAASSTESGMALRATEGDEDATAHRQLFQNGFSSVQWIQ